MLYQANLLRYYENEIFPRLTILPFDGDSARGRFDKTLGFKVPLA